MTYVYIAVLVLALGVLYGLRRGAVYLPSTQTAVEAMLRLGEVQPGMRVVDLGSGDGRIVMAFARAGCVSVGYEINPVLVLWSRLKIWGSGQKNAYILFKNFWSADLSDYDVVVVFGMTHIMKELSEKLEKELKPGTLVISNIFQFPDRRPHKHHHGIYVYRI